VGGIAQQKITYAIGNAAWGSKAAQEGIPVSQHFEPEPVMDSSTAPRVANSSRLPASEEFSIGAMYYTAPVPIAFNPAHAILLLDKFFGDTVVGASPNYDRNYEAEDVPGEASTPFLNIWKRTAKVGHDHNLCMHNGIVTGITISKEAEGVVMMTAYCAFGARSMDEADPDAWAIDWTHGVTAPALPGSTLFYIASIGGGFAAYAIPAFRITLSCEFTPHFFGSQNPDRFSRGKMVMDGELSLRDITSQVEDFGAWLEGSTTKKAAILFGGSTLYINFKIHAGGGAEDEITRNGRFSFTGIYEKNGIYPTGFRWLVRPKRPYTIP